MNWRSTICFSLCAIAVGVLCSACGTTGTDEADGGFEAGNPPAPTTTRSLKGEVEHRDDSASTRLLATTAASENCVVDPATVTATTLQINDTAGIPVTCDYAVTEDGAILNCSHTADPFVSLNSYTATLNGVTCVDGRAVETRSWSWAAFGVSSPVGGL